MAVELLSRLDLSDSNILADQAYGTNQILDYIQSADGVYTFRPMQFSQTVALRLEYLQYRHVIECFLQKLK